MYSVAVERESRWLKRSIYDQYTNGSPGPGATPSGPGIFDGWTSPPYAATGTNLVNSAMRLGLPERSAIIPKKCLSVFPSSFPGASRVRWQVSKSLLRCPSTAAKNR